MENVLITVNKKNFAYEPKSGVTGVPAPVDKENCFNEQRLLGAVIGNAVGDALGAPCEFRDRGSLLSKYPEGIRTMERAGQTGGKDPGSYTDDTELLVAIAKGIVAADGYNLAAIGAYFVEWKKGNPPDCGGQTARAIAAIGRGYAADGGYQTLSEGSEGNGSIMRNGVVFAFTRKASFSDMMVCAEQISALTHASEQCRTACAAMTLLQRLLCMMDAKSAIKDTYKRMVTYGAHPRVLECMARIINEKHMSASTLPPTGYVIDTFERAMWPLWHNLGFEEGLVTCVMQGGDADSAGAVCGSLLGTYYGFDSIPQQWVDAIRTSEVKHRDCQLEDLTKKVAEIGDRYWSAHSTITPIA